MLLGQDEPELLLCGRGSGGKRGIEDLLHAGARYDVGLGPPVRHRADCDAQVRRVTLVGHPQRLAQRISSAAGPGRHDAHDVSPYPSRKRIAPLLHCGCIAAAWWAGHMVEVFLRIYAHCIDGDDERWFGTMEDALGRG